ncbi:uncharacterized protein TNCV_3086751 [Trichonephila clavipes]|nr:uncharacterized protein TNCV_3086751 [Trichonephila clavipes]
MTEDRLSDNRVACQLGRSDCGGVRRYWNQWIREMSFTRKSGSGCPRKTNRQKDHHIVRNARIQPTVSSTAIHTQGLFHKELLCLLKPYEGTWLKDIWDCAPITCAALDTHPLTPQFGVVPRTRKLDYSGMEPGRL